MSRCCKRFSGSLYRLACILFITLSGCGLFDRSTEEDRGQPLARVYDKYLYSSEVELLGLSGLSPEDSMNLVNEYVRNWINRHLMVAYAERNLPKEDLDIEEQIENYRESLLVYNYETEYLAQKLDTAVTDDQIETYYQEHLTEFVLDEDIYRLNFIVTSSADSKADSVKIWMRDPKPEARFAMERFASRYAITANLNDSLWFSYTELASIFPKSYMGHITPGNRWTSSWSDTLRTYVSMIRGSEIKGSVAPLSYAHDRIKKIILLQRKNQVLDALRHSIEGDALKKGHYEIFQP